MIPKRETPDAIEERRIGSTKDARGSGRAMGKRKVIGVSLLVLGALIVNIISFSQSGLVRSGGAGITGTWVGFLAIPIFTGACLITAIVRVLRKR
jgi:hypothetical protein